MADRNVLDSDNPLAPGTTSGPANRSIGPSDSSDAGSDLDGLDRSDDSDRAGTGERLTAGDESAARSDDSDIGFDRIVDSEDAGLGGGLDQAEEAILGITDEEIAELARRGR